MKHCKKYKHRYCKENHLISIVNNAMFKKLFMQIATTALLYFAFISRYTSCIIIERNAP